MNIIFTLDRIKKYLEDEVKLHPQFSLENLSEKNRDEYIDVEFEENDVPQLFINIAEDLTKNIKEIKFSNNYGEHYFVKTSEQHIDFLNIEACIYADYEYNIDKESNYIFYIKDEENENNTLYIDIYFCITKDIKDIKQCIIQELYNFIRDMQWICDGYEIYDENMQQMKIDAERLKAEQNEQILNEPEFNKFLEEISLTLKDKKEK